MRLEFNPRALCYNLYCDTREEREKLKQMMEKPLTATDVKSIDHMIYADTDSIKVMKTKLNSIYGKMVTNMVKEYIVIHYNKRPIIIFKHSISSVVCESNGTATIYSDGRAFPTDEKYVDVVKRLI